MLRKQWKINCQSLLLVGFQQCMQYPLAQLAHFTLFGASEVWPFHQKLGSIWQAHHRLRYCPPLWLPSGPHYPGPVASHCVVHYKGIGLQTWTCGTNEWQCVLSQHYPQRLDIFSNCAQAHLKSHKADNPEWAALTSRFLATARAMTGVFAQNISILVKSNDSFAYQW